MIDYDRVSDTVAEHIDVANMCVVETTKLDIIDSRVDTLFLQAIISQNAAIITLLSTLVAQGKND